MTTRSASRYFVRADDVPVFPRYDLPGQFATIRLVGELTDVPVPTVWWCEPDPAPLGAPFFVMGRIDGRVPPDVMPYNFGDSWLYDADPADQRHLQDATVDVLARLHAIDRPVERFPFLVPDAAGGTPLRRRVAGTRAWYEFVDSSPFHRWLIDLVDGELLFRPKTGVESRFMATRRLFDVDRTLFARFYGHVFEAIDPAGDSEERSVCQLTLYWEVTIPFRIVSPPTYRQPTGGD